MSYKVWSEILVLYVFGKCKIVALSDSKGGIHNPNGFNPHSVFEHKRKTGSVMGYEGSKQITNEELIELNCDILVPAALENQITMKNAPNVKAQIVAEAANGPTTTEADRIPHEKGIFIIPDILANSRGVASSYFEWVQNLTRERWTEEKVNEKQETMMMKAFNDVYNMSKKQETDMRLAALMLGVGQVAEAIKTLGVWP